MCFFYVTVIVIHYLLPGNQIQQSLLAEKGGFPQPVQVMFCQHESSHCHCQEFAGRDTRRPDAETVQGLFTKGFNAKVQKANTQKIRAKTRISKNTEDPNLGTQIQAEQKHKKHCSKAEQEFRKAHS